MNDPWAHVTKQVLDGEFDGADKSTVESLTIGLGNNKSPPCRKALDKLLLNNKKSNE